MEEGEGERAQRALLITKLLEVASTARETDIRNHFLIAPVPGRRAVEAGSRSSPRLASGSTLCLSLPTPLVNPPQTMETLVALLLGALLVLLYYRLPAAASTHEAVCHCHDCTQLRHGASPSAQSSPVKRAVSSAPAVEREPVRVEQTSEDVPVTDPTPAAEDGWPEDDVEDEPSHNVGWPFATPLTRRHPPRAFRATRSPTSCRRSRASQRRRASTCATSASRRDTLSRRSPSRT